MQAVTDRRLVTDDDVPANEIIGVSSSNFDFESTLESLLVVPTTTTAATTQQQRGGQQQQKQFDASAVKVTGVTVSHSMNGTDIEYSKVPALKIPQLTPYIAPAPVHSSSSSSEQHHYHHSSHGHGHGDGHTQHQGQPHWGDAHAGDAKRIQPDELKEYLPDSEPLKFDDDKQVSGSVGAIHHYNLTYHQFSLSLSPSLMHCNHTIG